MPYRYLPEHLHEYADEVKQYFRGSRGLTNFKVEEPISPTLDYRPTLHSVTKDHHIVCIDVLETPYSSVLDGFVLDCVKKSIPVNLFVAFPEGSVQAEYKKNVDRARNNGVGVVEIKANGVVQVIHEALTLSLAGVREIDTRRFPAKYRAALAQAESTFRGGSPVEGCLIVYKEIEAVSRLIIEKTRAKGMWRALNPGDKNPRLRHNTPWQRVIETEIEHLDYNKCTFLDKPLLGRILSVAPHRNATGHKPRNIKEVIKRDTELKTRFESATDLLYDLVLAARPLRV